MSQYDTENDLGMTPLHRACYNGHVESVEFLLSNGADINAKDTVDWTPLHRACFNEELDCVKILITHGADINVKDSNGETPIDLLTPNSKPEIENFIAQMQAESLKQPDEDLS